MLTNKAVALLQRKCRLFARANCGMAGAELADFLPVRDAGGSPVPGQPVTIRLQPGSGGVLLSIRTEDPKPTYERLRDAKYPIATPMEISELADGDARITKTSFEIVDPDGYRLRFTD